MTEPKKSPRRRARKPDGKYKGDNPATPGLNQAWEATELDEAVGDKSVTYEVVKKIDTTSNPSAGKYSKKDLIRPTFGNVTTTTN